MENSEAQDGKLGLAVLGRARNEKMRPQLNWIERQPSLEKSTYPMPYACVLIKSSKI